MVKNKHLLRKMASYSILAGSAISYNQASGQILYHQVLPHDTIPENIRGGGGDQSYPLDINGDGSNDFTLLVRNEFHIDFSNTRYSFYANLIPAVKTEKIEDAGLYADVLQSGQSIKPGATWANNGQGGRLVDAFYFDGQGGQTNYQMTGNWPNQTDKFVGFRIRNKSNGTFNYGWLRLTVHIGLPFRSSFLQDTMYVVIEDYAIEQTPNKGIIAGDVGNCTPAVSLSAGGHRVLSPGDSTTLRVVGFKTSDVVTWFKNGTIIKSDSVNTLVVKEAASYHALVKNRNNCGELTNTISIKAAATLNEARELESVTPDYTVFVRNRILQGQIKEDDFAPNTVIIYDELGRQIVKQMISFNTFSIDLHSIASGIYIIRLLDGKTVFEKKVFVE